MAEWLKACGVDTVAIEATGVYWVPVYEVLEEAGIEAFLFDGRQTRHVSGRKTDVLDCQWSQKLHSHGLLTRAFRPDKQIATLRAYWRQRGGIVESCARQIHLMQKALEEMNIQLHKAVTDITGVTGMRILRAIVAGERDVHALAALRRGRIKATTEEVARALEGTYRQEHSLPRPGARSLRFLPAPTRGLLPGVGAPSRPDALRLRYSPDASSQATQEPTKL
jgi:transposase